MAENPGARSSPRKRKNDSQPSQVLSKQSSSKTVQSNELDCSVCSAQVSSMKILPCDHKFCLNCLQKIVKTSRAGKYTLTCPYCRSLHIISCSLDRLPTFYHGRLNCDSCRAQKSCDDIWWCPNCVQFLCSTCHLTNHDKEHRIYRWESLQAVKDCSAHSRRMATPPEDVPPGPEGVKKIREFCQNIESILLQKLKESTKVNGSSSAPTTRRGSSSSHPQLHECLDGLFGQLDTKQSNDLMCSGNSDRIPAAARQIVKIAHGGSDADADAMFQVARLNPRRMTVDSFTKSPDCFAKTIWASVKLKEEAAVMLPNSDGKADLRLSVNHFTQFAKEPDGTQILSPVTRVRGLPWRILAKVCHKDITAKKSFGFFLQCNTESDSMTWRCPADAVLRIVSQENGVPNFERKISHEFHSKENDWGYTLFTEIAHLVDPKNGFVKNDTVVLEVSLSAQMPTGI